MFYLEKKEDVFSGERTGGIFDIAKNFLKTPMRCITPVLQLLPH
jgi:hypothetical protein